MAALVRLCGRVFQQNAVSRQILPLSAVQWYSGAAGSMENTLGVKHRIEDIRERALLGGGQRRIDVQHKKVDVLHFHFVCLCNVKPKVVLIVPLHFFGGVVFFSLSLSSLQMRYNQLFGEVHYPTKRKRRM